MTYFPIAIPTSRAFVNQWHHWIHSKVKRHFKRDQDRMYDTAQNACLRLLSKDFIGRWFYKHLTDELVTLEQAQLILGGVNITLVGHISPVVGHRTKSESLWRVSDLLRLARFDYERYYYSIQNHTIDSKKMLHLLGYPAGQYTYLQSLWRQGRMQPAELTEHECPRRGIKASKPSNCPTCEHGLRLLRDRGLSLAHDWKTPEASAAAARLRWNDSQLRNFLRGWRRTNIIQCTPGEIMRTDPKAGVDAGLLKYAEFVINHEVINDFKRMSRSDDMSTMVFNNGLSPEVGDADSIAWESEDLDETPHRVFRDVGAIIKFSDLEQRRDIEAIIQNSCLSPEEEETIRAVDLLDIPVKQFAAEKQRPVQRVHRVRAAAMRRLRAVASIELPMVMADPAVEAALQLVVDQVCGQFSLTSNEILSGMTGPCVLARTELCCILSDMGWSVGDMMTRFDIPEALVVAAINRRVLKEIREGK